MELLFFSTYLPISIIHRATTRSQSAQFNFPRCLFPVIKTSSGEKCYFHEWRRVIMGTVPTSAIKGTEFHRAREHCAYIKSLGVRLTCLSLCFHGGSHARFSFIEPFSILSPISFPFFFHDPRFTLTIFENNLSIYRLWLLVVSFRISF